MKTALASPALPPPPLFGPPSAWPEQAQPVRPADRDRLLAQLHLASGRPAEAGHLLARLGLPREAAEAYEAGRHWSYAAYRWEAAGEPERAAEAYEKAGRPDHAARCYAAAGMTGRAVDAHLQAGDPAAAVGLHLRAGQLLEAASLLLAHGERSRAAQTLLRLQPSDPGFGAGTVLLAPLLIEEGFAADALDRLRRIPAPAARALDPGCSYWQGRALESLGREAEAEACYARVAALAPGSCDVEERLARLRGPATAPLGPATCPTRPRPDVLAVGGRVAGRYDIVAELGRGGMGRVFEAYDLELGERVAIKALLGAGDGGHGEEARLLQEIQICRRISHPNVVRVFDLGRFSGGIFLTMEYLEGRRLDQLIAAEAPLRFGRIRGLLAEIAAGLREAHALGIVHRDLKPGNVMITSTRLKILDFGIASMAGCEARKTRAGFVMGSPMYMSPEQILGHPLDGRSDLYSLGLLAATLIAGRDPYECLEPAALVFKQLHEAPRDLRAVRPDVSEPWLALVARLCAKEPAERYQSAHEVLEALAELPVE